MTLMQFRWNFLLLNDETKKKVNFDFNKLFTDCFIAESISVTFQPPSNRTLSLILRVKIDWLLFLAHLDLSVFWLWFTWFLCRKNKNASFCSWIWISREQQWRTQKIRYVYNTTDNRTSTFFHTDENVLWRRCNIALEVQRILWN